LLSFMKQFWGTKKRFSVRFLVIRLVVLHLGDVSRNSFESTRSLLFYNWNRSLMARDHVVFIFYFHLWIISPLRSTCNIIMRQFFFTSILNNDQSWRLLILFSFYTSISKVDQVMLLVLLALFRKIRNLRLLI